jgi:hypothetical protein
LNEADQASLAYLRAVSGTDSFDTKEKVELIPGPALRKLNSAWEVLGKGALGRRDWIRLSKPGVTTYKALFSLTTWLQQRMKDLSIG